MSAGLVLDLLLVLLLVGYAGSGFRQGLFVGALSLLGFVVGAVAASQLMPLLVADMSPGPTRSLVVLAGTVVAGVVGQALLGAAAGEVRERVTWRPARAVDAATGLVGSVVAVALVVWVVAGAVRVSPFPTLSRVVAESRVVGAVDEVVPGTVAGALDDWYASVSGELFPTVFAGPEPDLPVEDPDPGVTQDRAVVAAGAGVVRVSGEAEECGRGQEGTGFVVAAERVLTNAHVVAGMSDPDVQVGGSGERLDATVVVFDPDRDLAVLAVPGLRVRPLPLDEDPRVRGDDVVVAGFPLNGPYVLSPGRVREVLTAVGEDIYGTQQVAREVYALHAQVRPGNSGGPVLDGDGEVVGVVFARSLDDPSTGYAVTLAEAGPVLDAVSADEAVPTGACARA